MQYKNIYDSKKLFIAAQKYLFQYKNNYYTFLQSEIQMYL